MSYIEDNLIRGEKVIYKAHLHPIIFFWPVIFALIGVVIFISSSSNVGWIALLLGVVSVIGAAINYATSEFGITTRRIIAKFGFIKRYSIEVNLVKVEGVRVSQGILGRIIDYGTIVIDGIGGSREPIPNIYDPMELRKQIQVAIADLA